MKTFRDMTADERRAAQTRVAELIEYECSGCYYVVMYFTPNGTAISTNVLKKDVPALLRETADNTEKS